MVSDEEVMCDRERITGRKDLSCGEEVVWEDAGPRWCQMLCMKRLESFVVVVVERFLKLPEQDVVGYVKKAQKGIVCRVEYGTWDGR